MIRDSQRSVRLPQATVVRAEHSSSNRKSKSTCRIFMSLITMCLKRSVENEAERTRKSGFPGSKRSMHGCKLQVLKDITFDSCLVRIGGGGGLKFCVGSSPLQVADKIKIPSFSAMRAVYDFRRFTSLISYGGLFLHRLSSMHPVVHL